jgi:hypothetical protein
MDDGDPEGFGEGLSASRGDPRVLLLLNVILSAMFGTTVVWGLSLLDAAELSLINVATATVVLVALTYLVTNA